MLSPIAVGTSPVTAIGRNPIRSTVRFQNVGQTTLYFVKQFPTQLKVPSSTNYDFLIEKGGGAEINESVYETQSIERFDVISSGNNGSLAIIENIKVNLG